VKNYLSKPTVSLLASVALVILLVMLLRGLNLDAQVYGLLRTVESSGLAGAVLFMGVVGLFVILMLPSVLLTLGAGAVYGVVFGSLAIVVAETLGAIVAWLLGRTLLKGKVLRLLSDRPMLMNTLKLLRAKDWQLVAMLRMIPFFPFKLSNYLMGISPLTATTYAKGTFVGLWPISAFNVYLGSLANDLMALEQGQSLNKPANWMLTVTGLLLTAGVVILAVRRAMSALEELKTSELNQK